MALNYYQNGKNVLATISAMHLPEITKDEFDAKMQEIESGMNHTDAAPEPTPEERISALEEELAAAKILLGLEE